MLKKADKNAKRLQRHKRVRRKVFGTPQDQDYVYLEVQTIYMLK